MDEIEGVQVNGGVDLVLGCVVVVVDLVVVLVLVVVLFFQFFVIHVIFETRKQVHHLANRHSYGVVWQLG